MGMVASDIFANSADCLDLSGPDFFHRSSRRPGKIIRVAACALVIAILSACSAQEAEQRIFYRFTDDGRLVRPKDYRTWIFAGTGTTPKSFDSNAIFPDFQNVYIDPDSYKFWKENGYFRDGTILVKELIRKGETASPIGNGFFQGAPYSLSATIKDSKRFPKAPGGWEYFKFTDYDNAILTETSPALGGACIACHRNAKAGFGPFVELFMPLRDAKGVGADNPENSNKRGGLLANMPAHLREKE